MKSNFTFLRILFVSVLNLLPLIKVSTQTLEIHQMAIGNADSGMIIIRDTTRVMNAIRIGFLREKFTGDHLKEFEKQLTDKNFFSLPSAGSTAILEDIVKKIDPAKWDELNTYLNTTFDTDQKKVNMTQVLIDLAKTKSDKYIVKGTIKQLTIIDLGRKGTEDSHDAKTVYAYMVKQGFTGQVDNFILSHYHEDHCGGLQTFSGLAGVSFTNFYDSGSDKVAFTKADAENDHKMLVGDETYTKFYREVIQTSLGLPNLDEVDDLREANKKSPGDEINLENGAKLICVASNSAVYNDAGTFRGGTNPNDYSLAFVLYYKGFRFFTGGDISGISDKECNPYKDVETSLATGLAAVPELRRRVGGTADDGHICGLKVSHHGSRCSSNDVFLNRITSKVSIIPNGWDIYHYNPRKETFARLNSSASIEKIYCLGLMKDNVRPRKKAYKPWPAAGNLINTGKVIISGNTAVIVDDKNTDLTKSTFIVKWDGNLRGESDGKLDRLYPATSLPDPPFHSYICNH
jgi:hypothetical protein